MKSVNSDTSLLFLLFVSLPNTHLTIFWNALGPPHVIRPEEEAQKLCSPSKFYCSSFRTTTGGSETPATTPNTKKVGDGIGVNPAQ